MNKIEKSRIERAIIFLGLTFLVIWGSVNGYDFENDYLVVAMVAGYLWVFGVWIGYLLFWFEIDKLAEKEEELLQEKIYKVRQERRKLEAETKIIEVKIPKEKEGTKKQQ